MGLRALLVFVCIGFVTTAAADLPPGFPEITVSVCDNPSPGYIFLSNFCFDAALGNVPYLMILDNTGYPVSYKELASPLNLDFKLLSNGRLIYCDALEFIVLGDDLEPVDSFDAGNGWHTDAHEYRLLPNGHAYILAWKTRAVDMTAYGGRPNALVMDYAIQEIDNIGNVYWQWNTADHFEITDTTPDIPLTTVMIDYAHCNAIEICPNGDLLLSVRHFDEVTKINRQTGEIIWRMGGSFCENNEFTFLNDDFSDAAPFDYTSADPEQTRNRANHESGAPRYFGFSHQHAVRLLDDGHVILFDNGNMRSPQYSRAVEYEIDEEGRTVRKVWEYRNVPDVASAEMGCAWRLDNGSTLVGWGGNDQAVTVTEVRPDKSKAFELHLSDQIFSYRAYRFVYGMAAMMQTVDCAGVYAFSTDEQPTGVTLNLDSVTGSGSVTVERHNYGPRQVEFFGSRPLGSIVERRWVLRWPSSVELAGTLHLEGQAVAGLIDPAGATIWYRGTEGLGDFAPLVTSHRLDPTVIEADLIGPGELLLVDGTSDPISWVRLAPNAPNPFLASTAVRYSLPVESPIRLSLYTVSGREVRCLLEGTKSAGEHEYVLDASDLPGGIYFFRLQTSAGTSMRKAVRIRR